MSEYDKDVAELFMHCVQWVTDNKTRMVSSINAGLLLAGFSHQLLLAERWGIPQGIAAADAVRDFVRDVYQQSFFESAKVIAEHMIETYGPALEAEDKEVVNE
jgi:hypothetical protein